MRIVGRIRCVMCVAAMAVGCGSPVVEPGRGRSGPHGVSQPSLPAPGTAASPGALERVPLSQIAPRSGPDQPAIYHEVQAGETLTAIAAKYRVPTDRLIRANGLEKNSTLPPGQLIFVPQN